MAEHTRSLGEVIEILPDSCYDNPSWRGLSWLGRDALLYAAILAALVVVDAWYLLIPLWILAGLAVSALFVLGHDAAHGALFKSPRWNRVLGQAAMLPSLHLYEAWCFGHNRIHHGHTTRQVMDYVWHPLTPEQYAELGPLGRLMHRIEWSAFGAGLYYLVEIWWRQMVRFQPSEKLVAAFRRDRRIVGLYAAAVTALALAGGVWMYGTALGAVWMWTKTLLVPFLVWNYSIGMTVYVHHIAPDIAWHPRKGWTKFKGQMEGTTILHVPAWLNVFYHNIFLHVPHHVDMRIPFYRLPIAVTALREHFGDVVRERDWSFREYVRTTRACKLFDFDRQVWLTYAGEVLHPVELPADAPADTAPADDLPRVATGR